MSDLHSNSADGILPEIIGPAKALGQPMSQDVPECPKKAANCLPILPKPDEPKTTELRLTERQMTAITLLNLGHTHGAVAATVGVDRRTIYRWRLHNPVFAAELHRRQHELYQVLGNRIRMLALKCVRVVDTELSRKRRYGELPPKAYALDVLRATGLLRSEPTGPENLDAATDAQILADRPESEVFISERDREEVLSYWANDPEGEIHPLNRSSEFFRRLAWGLPEENE